jgi:hypothetical protein
MTFLSPDAPAGNDTIFEIVFKEIGHQSSQGMVGCASNIEGAIMESGDEKSGGTIFTMRDNWENPEGMTKDSRRC